MTDRVVMIGAGVGGLTTAAALARSGLDVTVLEAHVYAGGCAGTFFHKGYRFDAGATLAGGFYPGGPMDLAAQAAGVQAWPVRPASPAMVVHLSSGEQVKRFSDERRRDERERVFGSGANEFWQWQEDTADALWDLAVRNPAWPPQSPGQAIGLGRKLAQWAGSNPRDHLHPKMLRDTFGHVGHHLKNASPQLREFIDAQLLISAQTTSNYTNALFGAAALDLPRREVVHVEGGMGAIASTLVEAIRRHGGRVQFKHEVKSIRRNENNSYTIGTSRGEYPADRIIANLPPWQFAALLGNAAPQKLRRPKPPADSWGAFMVYAGLEENLLPKDFPLHHQVIRGAPYGERNTIFISVSPEWDKSRAPAGFRAVTISTHTRLKPWWELHKADSQSYEARKKEYMGDMLTLAERAVPGISGTKFTMPGTPITFSRFTRRKNGWVGGFPQTNLFRTTAPRVGPGLWLVGDSIFPGQSVAAVALGGIRVASDVLGQAAGVERRMVHQKQDQESKLTLGNSRRKTS